MKSSFFSLRNKIFILFFIFLLIQTTLITTILLLRNYQSKIAETKNKVLLIKDFIIKEISPSVKFEIKEKTIETIDNFRNIESNIKYVEILKDKNSFYAFEPEIGNKCKKYFNMDADNIQIKEMYGQILCLSPIQYKQDTIGQLFIGYSIDSIKKDLNNDILYSIIVSISIGTFLFIFLIFFIRKITKSINEISIILQFLSEGDLTKKVKL